MMNKILKFWAVKLLLESEMKLRWHNDDCVARVIFFIIIINITVNPLSQSKQTRFYGSLDSIKKINRRSIENI